MKDKQTKDELSERVAELVHENEKLLLDDQLKRKEFAKSFRWGSPKKDYYGGINRTNSLEEWDWKLPTWEQIFVEIGKLKSLMDYREFEGNISELECKLEDLEKNIRKEIYPNLP